MLHERGLKNTEISSVLGVAVRSVQRYLEELRERLAIDPTPALSRQIVGVYHQSREQRVRNLSRIAQDPKVPPVIRVEAETRIFQIETMYVKTMQSAGYVTLANSAGEFEPGGAGPVSIPGIVSELFRLAEVSRMRLSADDPTRLELEKAGDVITQHIPKEKQNA
jgi:hypothetical protein